MIEQLDFFTFDHHERKLQELLEKVKKEQPQLDVVAVCIPDAEMKRAEPSFAIWEDEKYKLYEVLHGHIIFRPSILTVCDELPNKYWTKLKEVKK